VTPLEFRRLGHELVEWIARYRETLESRAVMSSAAPGDLRAALPAAPPEMGASLDGILAEVERVVMPGITHWNHPSFFAYFPSNAGLASVLADLLSSGLGVQGMSWQTSPAATELEEVVMEWLRQMLGLPDPFVGVIQDTASTATLVALVCARERATQHGQTRAGLQGEERPLSVYASAEAHSSVVKAAVLAGLGRENVRLIETDGEYALRLDALRSAIERDLASGKRPCAIVATVGTTGTTAVDPVRACAELAREHGLWLHVDAALAGSAMILPECRYLWDGIEGADSLVLNPHKWLGVAFDCSAYYVRDARHLTRVMSTNPSYLQTAADAEVKNFRDWGVPLGRRFRALKLWFLIRDQGVAGLQARLRRDIEHARWLAAQVDAAPDWVRLAPVPFQTVCVRHQPAGLDGATTDAHNRAWADRLNRSGRAYVTAAVIQGRQLVRLSIGAEATERVHVERLWADVRWAADKRQR
jgi:aromatic-L-amino-acid/L-tryptophan decarboxylase